MSLTAAQTSKIAEEYQRSSTDCGSTEVQVALFSARIKQLTDHFKVNKKDNHSRYGLQTLVNRRRSLLKYLKRTSLQRYRTLIERLGLRDSY